MKMKTIMPSLRKGNAMKLKSIIFNTKIGDKIFDKRNNRIGTVVKFGQSGNYDLIYVDFGQKRPKRICPMDDAQVGPNYFRIVED